MSVTQLRLKKLEGAHEDQTVGIAILNQDKAGSGSYGYNAASGAGLLLTTEVMIAEAPKEEDHGHAGGGMPGGMGGMDM